MKVTVNSNINQIYTGYGSVALIQLAYQNYILCFIKLPKK